MMYAELAAELAERAFITDPYVEGQPRFCADATVISRSTYLAMGEAAESVTAVLNELCQIVAAEPALLHDFFHLTAVQRLMFEMSFPMWHGHARADVFLGADAKPIVCEVNCDTPSGQPEAVALNAFAYEKAQEAREDLADPCAKLMSVLVALVGNVARRLAISPSAPVVGIVYPTEMPEDLALITMWRLALEARGYTVVLGSPFNLHPTPDGGVALFGQHIDIVLRHYKTDWWAERAPLWHDEEPYPDAAPLTAPLTLLLQAQLRGKVLVLNPFGAVLPQNKRSYAFLWEQRDRFSAAAQNIIDAHVPFSLRMEAANLEELRKQRAGWVLKSDYGCEGEEVLIGAAMTDQTWHEALRLARPHRWIVQRRFDPISDEAGCVANHGIFLAAGKAIGIYTRRSVGATDRRAISVPTLVSP